MFTGIIESTAVLVSKLKNGSNIQFEFSSDLSNELKVDQSLSHNGICLTIEKIEKQNYFVTAIDETLKKTNLGELEIGKKVNLERCMLANGRFDGHIVQGHVDQKGICQHINDASGSWEISFSFDASQGNVLVEKGSICINGISLTVFNVTENSFSVAIIPYTWEHTNMSEIKVGQTVNLEFDILGKYISKLLNRNQ
jgi:riboflavin synthase